MRYTRFILSYLFYLSFVISACAQVDSLSYALGFAASAELLPGDNNLFRTDADLEAYISGLEQNVPSGTLVDDACYVRNYSLGVMQGNYIANSLAQSYEDWKARVKCISSGVRKVADRSVSLPADTIGLTERLKVMDDTVALNRMTESEICDIYAGYGILNGLQPDLQQAIDRYGGNGVEADYRYFASGIVDILDSMNPASAYDLGRSSGKLLIINTLAFPGFKLSDYINGAKAAFRLSPPLLSQQEVEAVIEAAFDKRESAYTEREKKKIISGDREYVSGDVCEVDWNVSCLSVPSSDEVSADIMEEYNRAISRLMDRFGIKNMIQLRFSEFMRFFREPAVERDEILKFIKSLNNNISQGYKLFCFRSLSGEWTIGLASEENPFEAHIGEAVVEVYDESQPIIGLSFVFSDRVEQWKNFTKANTGKTVVMEINDEAVMAPSINSEITTGVCSVSVSSIGEFIRLINSVSVMP